MKARNLFYTFFACLLLCYGSLSIADDSIPDSDLALEPEVTVNINTADADKMASVLSGVGISRAYAIVEYRETNGKFYSAEELSAVRGIGMKTIEKNADKIIVE